MRKISVFICVVSLVLYLVSCSGKKQESVTLSEGIPTVSVDTVAIEAKDIPNASVDTVAIKAKVVGEIKSWGAKDAYVDDENYFVYGVEAGDLSASGDEVAGAMYPMVEEIPGIKGVKVQDVKTKKILGKYDK